MGIGMSKTMRKGVQGGIAASISVVIVTAIGFSLAVRPETVLEPALLTYIGWVAGVTFLGSLAVATYYDSLPDRTPVHKLFWASLLVGIPAYASGQLLPTTRPFLEPSLSISAGLTAPANLSFLVLGGIVTMWVFLYVFDWKDSSNPFFSAGESFR